MSLLKVWFGVTALFVAGAMIWAFAPLLVPMLALTAAMGALVAGIVALARWIERRRITDPGVLQKPE